MLRNPHKKRHIKKLAAPAIYANVRTNEDGIMQWQLLFVTAQMNARVRDQTPMVTSETAFRKLEKNKRRGDFYGIAYTDYDKFTHRGTNKEQRDSGFVACVAGMTTIINNYEDTITAGTLLRVAVTDDRVYMRPCKEDEYYADAKAVTTARKNMQMDIILRPAYTYPYEGKGVAAKESRMRIDSVEEY